RDLAGRRLLRALGDQLLTAQRPEQAVAPALEQLARFLRLRGAVVVDANGRAVADYGETPPGGATAALALPLPGAGGPLGEARFGPRRDGEPYDAAEAALLGEAADFIAASLQLAARQADHAAALDALAAERAAW